MPTPIVVELAILGNGVVKHCLEKGATIEDLFEQAGEPEGETIMMNGRKVSSSTKLKNDAVVTSTTAVKGG